MSWRSISKGRGPGADPSLRQEAGAAFIINLSEGQINISALRDVMTEAANALERIDMSGYKGSIDGKDALHYKGVFTNALRNVSGLGALLPALSGASLGDSIDDVLLSLGDLDMDVNKLKDSFSIIWEAIILPPIKSDGVAVQVGVLDFVRNVGPLLFLLRNPDAGPEHIGRVARVMAKTFDRHLSTLFDGTIIDTSQGSSQVGQDNQKSKPSINFSHAN
jgi:hypothetical protein